MKLFIATKNEGKVKEFRQMLGDDRYQWADLSSTRIDPPEETGDTFLANACLKAQYYAQATRAWALADDSGLEVDALDGKPGIVSSRWAKLHDAGEGDAANNALLLKQLAEVPQAKRTARFVCSLALSDPAGRIVLTAAGSIEGRLLAELRGGNGFGYDPLFLVPALGRTSAELSPEEKHRISHRGQALRRLRQLMDQWMPGDNQTDQSP
jgi:XTP/dITP diphosphohydrolase